MCAAVGLTEHHHRLLALEPVYRAFIVGYSCVFMLARCLLSLAGGYRAVMLSLVVEKNYDDVYYFCFEILWKGT